MARRKTHGGNAAPPNLPVGGKDRTLIMEPKCKILNAARPFGERANVPIVPVVARGDNNKSSGPRGGSHKFIKHTYKKNKLNQVLLSHGDS